MSWMNIDRLCEQTIRLGVALTDEQIGKLDTYARLLVEWNEKMNLTAITEPDEVAVKHFADSLALLSLLPTQSFSLIDVGTGAGFPGVPLKIIRPDMRLTLLDSLNKRLLFLEEVCRTLSLESVTLIHDRAEEAGRKPQLREQFDVATARAVAALPTLCEYCLPLVRVGGRFIAMKGPEGEQEMQAAARAVAQLGGKCRDVRTVTLTTSRETLERRLILIDKTSHTPAQYPRHSSKIKKQPL